MNTLQSIGAALALIVGIGASTATIYKFISGTMKKLFDAQTKDISDRLDKQEAAISRVDMENCKNFLVSFLSRLERGEQIDEIERERFFEQYEHYSQLGGNSYIQNKVQRLKNGGKL